MVGGLIYSSGDKMRNFGFEKATELNDHKSQNMSNMNHLWSFNPAHFLFAKIFILSSLEYNSNPGEKVDSCLFGIFLLVAHYKSICYSHTFHSLRPSLIALFDEFSAF